MTKHTQGPSPQMIHHAKAMIKNGHAIQWIDAQMLSEYQGKKGLKACKEAIEIAQMELAAPDLLDALEDTLWAIEQFKKRTSLDLERSYPVLFDHLPRARAAINKAKGE